MRPFCFQDISDRGRRRTGRFEATYFYVTQTVRAPHPGCPAGTARLRAPANSWRYQERITTHRFGSNCKTARNLELLDKETRYSRELSRPSGLRLVTKQLERVPAFGPSTRRTIARTDVSDSAPTLSTTTRCPSGVRKNWPTMLVGDSFSTETVFMETVYA
jgi:hypothetical protein